MIGPAEQMELASGMRLSIFFDTNPGEWDDTSLPEAGIDPPGDGVHRADGGLDALTGRRVFDWRAVGQPFSGAVVELGGDPVEVGCAVHRRRYDALGSEVMRWIDKSCATRWSRQG